MLSAHNEFLLARIKLYRIRVDITRSRFALRIGNINCTTYFVNCLYKNPRAVLGDLSYIKLLACLFNCNCNTDSHTDHRVVTCSEEAHHLNVKVPCSTFGITNREATVLYCRQNRACRNEIANILSF